MSSSGSNSSSSSSSSSSSGSSSGSSSSGSSSPHRGAGLTIPTRCDRYPEGVGVLAEALAEILRRYFAINIATSPST